MAGATGPTLPVSRSWWRSAGQKPPISTGLANSRNDWP